MTAPMHDQEPPRQRDFFDDLLSVINVRFWQLVIICGLLGVALGFALAAI